MAYKNNISKAKKDSILINEAYKIVQEFENMSRFHPNNDPSRQFHLNTILWTSFINGDPEKPFQTRKSLRFQNKASRDPKKPDLQKNNSFYTENENMGISGLSHNFQLTNQQTPRIENCASENLIGYLDGKTNINETGIK